MYFPIIHVISRHVYDWYSRIFHTFLRLPNKLSVYACIWRRPQFTSWKVARENGLASLGNSVSPFFYLASPPIHKRGSFFHIANQDSWCLNRRVPTWSPVSRAHVLYTEQFNVKCTCAIVNRGIPRVLKSW